MSKPINFFKKRAKALLKLIRQNDDEALNCVRNAYRHNPTVLDQFGLMQAQHAVAVEHGFKGWADLLAASENNLRVAIAAVRANARVAAPPLSAMRQAWSHELEDTVREAIFDLACKLIDEESAVNSCMAETNCTGFYPDVIEILDLGSLESGRRTFRAEVSYAGDQDEDRMFFGDTINAKISGEVYLDDDDGWEVAPGYEVSADVDSDDAPPVSYQPGAIKRSAASGTQEAHTPTKNRRVRHMTVHCDYQTPNHAGASGLFQVLELVEEGCDVTDLVDQGTFWSSVAELANHLSHVTSANVELETGG